MEALQSIIGEDEQTRTMLLEMSGGDVETAVAIYFSMNEQESSGSAPSSTSSNNTPTSLPEWYNLIWPSTDAPPESWLSQRLQFDTNQGLKLSQKLNGPCGVLAAFQAAVIAQCHLQNIEAFHDQGIAYEPTTQLIGQTLKNMLSLSLPKGQNTQMIHIARWSEEESGDGRGGGGGKRGENIVVDEVNVNDPTIEQILVRNLCVEGGCILLVISAVLTKSCSLIRQELSIEGTSSLIAPNTNICMMELVSLLLSGKATSNILAYDPITQKKQPAWNNSPLGVGLLSSHEYDGQPLADDLKNPKTPVWLLHGGDHFTVLFSTLKNTKSLLQNNIENDETVNDEIDENNKPFSNKPFYHWNGLKPNGPRMAYLDITSPYQLKQAPVIMKMNYRKPEQGEIEDVVQGDKKTENWREWNFEVVLAVKEDYAEENTSTDVAEDKKEAEEEGGRGSDSSQSKDMVKNNVILFDFNQYPCSPDQRWRCRNCYATRFKTMCFGLNEPSTDPEVKCENCGKLRKEVGHSIWLPFHELPQKWQEVVENRHGPKIIPLLRTKWPSASITLIRTDDTADTLPGI